MAYDCPWWQVFFDSADSLILSRFPGAEETEEEIEGLKRLVPLKAEDRIADVCCGMGRHLLPLVHDGYQVVGLDRSPMMLALAWQGAQAAGLRARLVLGDSSRLPFKDESLDVVLNLFNSFGYFEREEDDRRVLREAARCLKPGGRFLLDTRNKKHQILFAPYHEPMKLHDGRELVMRCGFDSVTQRLTSQWFDGEDQSRLVHEASIRLYAPGEIEAMLEEAGLVVQARYGDYEGNEFEGWERQLLFVCEKG